MGHFHKFVSTKAVVVSQFIAYSSYADKVLELIFGTDYGISYNSRQFLTFRRVGSDNTLPSEVEFTCNSIKSCSKTKCFKTSDMIFKVSSADKGALAIKQYVKGKIVAACQGLLSSYQWYRVSYCF